MKEEEISRILGGIKVVRPLVIGAVGGQQIAKPVEILLYKERISIFLHHLYILNKKIDADLSGMQLEIDIAQWETGPIFPSEREKIDYFSVTEAGSFLKAVRNYNHIFMRILLIDFHQNCNALKIVK